MQITVSGKQVELSDALQERVSTELTGITGKYFDHQQEARANDQAYDAEARQRLWDLSMELTDAEKIDFVPD